MDKQGSKKNQGHGPGPGTFGVRGKVGNLCPAGVGKGQIGKTVKANPGAKKKQPKVQGG